MHALASAHMPPDTSYLCRCRRSVPAAEGIVPSLNALVDKTWVEGSGVSLLIDATTQAHSAALRIIQSSRHSGELSCTLAGLVSHACHTTFWLQICAFFSLTACTCRPSPHGCHVLQTQKQPAES